MKQFWLGSAALLLLSAGVASATDMPIKAPVYKAAAPFNWDGVYVGLHAGYATGDDPVFFGDFVPAVIGKPSPKGWLGGVQVGYNKMMATHWLLGGEVDFSAADIHDTSPFTGPTVGPGRAKIDYLGTARTRLGYVVDRTMIYATGGVAWAHEDVVFAPLPPLRRIDDGHVGWAFGGGLEYAMDAHWSAKIEYLYATLGRSRMQVLGGPLTTTDPTLNIVRAGINYKFGDSSGYDRPSMPVKAYAPRFSWTGAYLGVHAGYGSGRFTAFDIVNGQSTSLDPKGWLGGFQSGFNWQVSPNWLLGVESDTSFAGISKNGLSTPGAEATRTKVDDFGNLRTRLGYVMDRTVAYGTGGVAWAHNKFTETTGGAVDFSMKSYLLGWTVGGGIEYAIDPNWSAKVEYLYADFGHLKYATTPGLSTYDLNMSTVKVGLNYHGPVLERLFGAQ